MSKLRTLLVLVLMAGLAMVALSSRATPAAAQSRLHGQPYGCQINKTACTPAPAAVCQSNGSVNSVSNNCAPTLLPKTGGAPARQPAPIGQWAGLLALALVCLVGGRALHLQARRQT
ncbi:MAG: hypothetical protein ACRDFX_07990 [Chloroflexota bacterium]